MKSLQDQLSNLSRDFVQQKEYIRLLVTAIERSHAQCAERTRRSRLRVDALKSELEIATAALAKDEEDTRALYRALLSVKELGPESEKAPSALVELSSVPDERKSNPPLTCAEIAKDSNINTRSTPAPSPSASIPTVPLLSDCAPNAAGWALPSNPAGGDLILMPSPYSPVRFDDFYRTCAATLRA